MQCGDLVERPRRVDLRPQLAVVSPVAFPGRQPGGEEDQVLLGVPALVLKRLKPPNRLGGDRFSGQFPQFPETVEELFQLLQRFALPGAPFLPTGDRFLKPVHPGLERGFLLSRGFPVRRLDERVRQHGQRVGEPSPGARREYGTRAQVEQSGAQRQQVPGQISAVHRGDVPRGKGLERLHIVPVEKMAAVSFHFFQDAQGISGPPHQVPGREVAEVVGAEVRQEREPDIGGGSHAGRARFGFFLVIVRGEPVAIGGDERFKKAPRFAADLPQVSRLPGGQAGAAFLQGPAHPPGEHGREKPDAEHDPGLEAERLAEQNDAAAGGQGPQGNGQHQAAVAAERAAGPLPGLPGRGPFEQPAMGNEHAPEGAHDRVEIEEGLVGQHREHEDGLEEPAEKRRSQGKQVKPERIFIGLPDRFPQGFGKDGEQEDHGGRGQSQPGRGQKNPGQHHKERQAAGNEAAPEVVEDFPTGQGRYRVFSRRPTRPGHAGQKPRGDLPVSPDPAVAPRIVLAVTGREILDQPDVARQSGAGVGAFQEVVAQNPVLGQAAGQGARERVDIVDTLPRERTLLKEILVDVGNRPRIGIDSGFAAEDHGVHGAPRRAQAGDHPGLENRVAARDPLFRPIGAGRVERMRHRLYEQPGRIAGKLGIDVERQDIFDPREHRGIAGRQQGRRFGRAQGVVQRLEFPPLPFVAHPELFPRVP